MASAYEDIGDGYQRVPKTLILACCDCSLCHDIYFRVRVVKGKPQLEWKVDRNNRATAALRRHKKKRRASHS